MSNIKYVAQKAGESIATVSFFLDHKRVSEENSRKNADAIKELNYIPSRTGRSLRSGQSQIGVMFPNIQEPYYEKLFSGIKHYFTYHSIPYSLYLTNENTEKEMNIVADLLGIKANGIILYSCNPEKEELKAMLSQTDTPILFLDRKPLDYDGNFVASDNFALFSNLVDFFSKAGRKDMVLLRSTGSFQETDSAEEGFRHGLKKTGLRPKILFAKSARESGFKSVFEHLRNNREPEVLLCTSF
jgi:DNA-binding LacI/PurR family transcriptional regulator